MRWSKEGVSQNEWVEDLMTELGRQREGKESRVSQSDVDSRRLKLSKNEFLIMTNRREKRERSMVECRLTFLLLGSFPHLEPLVPSKI